ncbi:hypothetical protein BH11CYA1_BH11CYA1_44300 [soil metagenome]
MLENDSNSTVSMNNLQLNDQQLGNEPVNKVWLAVIAGLLIATSNTWLFHPQIKQSTYSAPWVHPGYEPGQTHSI